MSQTPEDVPADTYLIQKYRPISQAYAPEIARLAAIGKAAAAEWRVQFGKPRAWINMYPTVKRDGSLRLSVVVMSDDSDNHIEIARLFGSI